MIVYCECISCKYNNNKRCLVDDILVIEEKGRCKNRVINYE